jgi:hypothetical protein
MCTLASFATYPDDPNTNVRTLSELSDWKSTRVQPNFVPFIVEAGGYIRRAHLFLDALRGFRVPSRPAADSQTPGHFGGPSPPRCRRAQGVVQGYAMLVHYSIPLAQVCAYMSVRPVLCPHVKIRLYKLS